MKLSKNDSFTLRDRHIVLLEILLIFGISAFPLFRAFRADPTVYLSWEGAYRLYLGQVPYKDFGLPLGFGYWIIPAIFFKIFGPLLSTLIKAQVLINILGAFAFRSILKSFRVAPMVRLLSVMIFAISYIFANRWPWYNSSVIVFELIGMAFLMYYITNRTLKFRLIYLFAAAFFLFLTFFTKQDSGGLAFVFAIVMVTCASIYEKRYWSLIFFLIFYLVIALAIITPFIPYGFSYWFDYGQAPHSARISIYDMIDLFMVESKWIKFYLLAIVLILIKERGNFASFLKKENEVLFTIFILGILCQASIIQVTSYVPVDGNIFFHSFAIAYIFSAIRLDEKINLRSIPVFIVSSAMILLWWSTVPWKTVSSAIVSKFPKLVQTDPNVVSMRTFILANTDHTKKPQKWVNPSWREFHGIEMSEESVLGIQRLLNLKVVKEKKDSLKFLNMSELTPLEAVLKVKLETGPDIPLWYHKNVGIFEKEINAYNSKIKSGYYDLVLFEYIPILNNFYPFEVRDTLQKYYRQVDSFSSHRDGPGTFEVYIKKDVQ